jgi:hypothetical protein
MDAPFVYPFERPSRPERPQSAVDDPKRRDVGRSEASLPEDLTVAGAIATWRGRASRDWPEPLLAAGELHGVMPGLKPGR